MYKATTIIGITRKGKQALGGDGQVTLGDTVVKSHASKVRKLYNGTVLAGFAGASADAFTLFDRFEKKLEEHKGGLVRAAVELAKDWRTDRYLRRLEALLAIMDKDTGLIISGTGDVIEPDDGIIAIGSGSQYARAAAKALLDHTKMDAASIVSESLKIASSICIYTNDNISVLEIDDGNAKK